MEQLEAFRKKKAAERRERTERIQARLQQIRDKSATVARNNSARYKGAVQKPATRLPADRTLKDSTNRVTTSSTKRELSSHAKLVARSLKQKQPSAGDEMAAERRLTVTLSNASETNGTEAGLTSKTDVKNSGESAADKNVPQNNDFSSNVNFSCENNRKSALGKR